MLYEQYLIDPKFKTAKNFGEQRAAVREYLNKVPIT